MKRVICLLLIALLAIPFLAACTKEAPAAATPETTAAPETTEETTEAAAEGALPDGVYTAKFTTDSSMFHVNEALEDRGTLTVEKGVMTLHVTLASKSILNLFPGKAEDAGKDGAVLLEPTVDEVKYKDGTTDTAYGFDIPVPALDEEFDLALIGKKGKWYDHLVMVSDVQPLN